jgi:hypothetical protein
MTVTVGHPWISRDDFDYQHGHVVREFNNLEDAGEYLSKEVHPKVAPIQRRQLAALKERSGKPGLSEYADLLVEGSERSLEQLQAAAAHGLFSLPWHVNFYEHINYEGKSFCLGVVQKLHPLVALNPVILGSCDWDDDLRNRGGGPNNGNWNDCISSVRCNGVAKYWALCEDIHFRGRVYIGCGDVADLRQVGGNFNDITSSIVMCSIPKDVIMIALSILQRAIAAE